jgi:hypothetical protein
MRYASIIAFIIVLFGGTLFPPTTSEAFPKDIVWEESKSLPPFEVPLMSSLSKLQKASLFDMLSQSEISMEVKCVGIFNFSVEKRVAEKRALNACKDLKKTAPYLNYYIGTREGTQIELGGVEIAFGEIVQDEYFSDSPAAAPVPFGRYYSDQTDAISGFQIKPIYFVPSDVEDLYKDIDGTILGYINEGTELLESRLGNSFAIDTTSEGVLDIGYIRSVYSEAEMLSMIRNGGILKLLEGTDFEVDSGKNKKLIMFFIESDSSSKGFCGMAHIGSTTPGITSISGGCDSKVVPEFDAYPSIVWVHEAFHQLGVKHNTDPCDLMYGKLTQETSSVCANGNYKVIDPNNEFYINNDFSGVDMNKLDVWREPNLVSSHDRNECRILSEAGLPAGDAYYCKTGTSHLIMKGDSFSKELEPVLMIYKDSKWSEMESLETGNAADLTARELGLFCSPKPWAAYKVQVLSPQINWYKWVIGTKSNAPFKVIFQD